MTLTRQIIGLLLWFLVTFLAAALGSVASIQAASFYSNLARPEWAPPSWLFGPVWTSLYTLMAIAAWLVWRRAGFHPARLALTLYLIQLAFNALWSWLFFQFQLGGWAFANILLLLVLIGATLLQIWRIQKVAGLLLLPYWLWVAFAGFLNYQVWQMNPQL